MKGIFMTELEILEHEGTGPWLMEIKKKAFLEGAASVIYDLATVPEEIKNKDGKISTKKVAEWAEKQLAAINNELNQLSAFELIFMLTDNYRKRKTEIEAKTV